MTTACPLDALTGLTHDQHRRHSGHHDAESHHGNRCHERKRDGDDECQGRREDRQWPDSTERVSGERRALLAEGQHAHDQRNPQQHLGVCEPGEREERGGQDDAARYAS